MVYLYVYLGRMTVCKNSPSLLTNGCPKQLQRYSIVSFCLVICIYLGCPYGLFYRDRQFVVLCVFTIDSSTLIHFLWIGVYVGYLLCILEGSFRMSTLNVSALMIRIASEVFSIAKLRPVNYVTACIDLSYYIST